MFNVGRSNYFISRKETVSLDMLKRAKFVRDNMPLKLLESGLIPEAKLRHSNPPELKFDEINSSIRGIPQGEDQMRDPTASGVFCDEMAFWEWAEPTYGALKPALEGGGRIICVSTPQIGFFQQLVLDKLDE